MSEGSYGLGWGSMGELSRVGPDVLNGVQGGHVTSEISMGRAQQSHNKRLLHAGEQATAVFLLSEGGRAEP